MSELTDEKPKILKLSSPVGAKPIYFPWPLPDSRRADIVNTIHWVIKEFPELYTALENNVLAKLDTCCFTSMQQMCGRFNRTMKQVVALEKGTSLPAYRRSPIASKDLLKHILQQAYNEAAAEMDKFGENELYSPGKPSFDMVAQMIGCIETSQDEVFLNLGSDMGQVVFQVAASTNCRMCYGIERAELPLRYAQAMDRSFRVWMKWYGKIFTEYELIQGNFLLPEHQDKIRCASIIYADNSVFSPAVNQSLKDIFIKLDDGTRIISTQSFSPKTGEKRSSMDNVMQVSQMYASVSGISQPYYMHVINRSKYFNGPTPAKRARKMEPSEMLQQQSVDLDIYRPQSSDMLQWMQSVELREQVNMIISIENERNGAIAATETNLESIGRRLKEQGVDISPVTPMAMLEAPDSIFGQHCQLLAQEETPEWEIIELEQNQDSPSLGMVIVEQEPVTANAHFNELEDQISGLEDQMVTPDDHQEGLTKQE